MSDETTRLRALLERATQTPWRQDGAEIAVVGSTLGVGGGETVIAECTLPDCIEVADEDREEQEERNAALIVAAVNALPGLLDAAERAERDDIATQLAAVTAERDDMRRERDAAASRARSFAGLVRSLGAEVRRVVRERDELAARHDDARADYAAVNEYLGGIVRVWQRADDDERRMADTFVSGLRREIEEARDSGRGEWWEVCRGGSPAPLRTELAVRRAQQAPMLDAHDALVAAARAAGWTGAGATGEELVAWVRRGEWEACAARCERAADGEHVMGDGDRRDGDMRHAEIRGGRASALRQMARAIRKGGE